MDRYTILIVDDDKGQQLRLSTLLQQAGFDIRLADSATEALQSARQSPPGVVLSDVMMEQMDGYELAMAMKSDPQLRHIPLVLHSSVFTQNRDRLLAEALGVDAFFDKSVAPETLLAKLHALASRAPIEPTTAVDEQQFRRMHTNVLSEKVGLKLAELDGERDRADASARQLRAISDALPDLIAEIGRDLRYQYVNLAYEKWHGRKREEIIGMRVDQLHSAQGYQQIRPQLERALQGEAVGYEGRFNFPLTGERDVWVRYLPHRNQQQEISSVHVIVSDITERKHALMQLQKTNRGYETLLQLNALLTRTDDEQQLLQEACKLIGTEGEYPLVCIEQLAVERQPATVTGQPAFYCWHHSSISGEQDWEACRVGNKLDVMTLRGGTPQVFTDTSEGGVHALWPELATRLGLSSAVTLPIVVDHATLFALTIYSRNNAAFFADDKELLGKIATDISQGVHTLHLMHERDQIELSLRKANRAYRTLVRLKQALAHHHDEDALLREVSRILIYGGSYSLAWIGYTEESGQKRIQPVATAGDLDDYLQSTSYSWDDEPHSHPAGTAVRLAQTVILNDIGSEPSQAPWRDKAIDHGYFSVIAIPLKGDGRVFGAITLYASVKNAFHQEEVLLLEEFAEELAFGIMNLREHDRHQQVAGELAYQRKLFEAVFRHIPDTMIITDTEHRIILCNSALIRDFGYLPEQLIGKTPAILYAEQEQFKRQQQLRYHDAASDVHTPYTIEYRRRDGSTFQGETLGAIFRDKNQKPLGYISIVRDITERQLMEHERTQLELQLRQAQKMETVGQLTGGIAHDFNNILASILGYSELALHRCDLLADPQGERVKHYLEEIHGAGGRARDIISQLLAFSRTGTIERRKVSLQSLIEETASLLRPTLSSSIALTLDIDEQLPQIEADPNQLHQVLMNLCINARDAMEGRGNITIGLHRVQEHHGLCSACGESFHGNYLQLSTSDNGPGIPDNVLSRMFDPFFTTKEVGKGSGMGLSMVHGIVHNHGGHIEVSTSGSGSAFRIYLPTQERPSLGLGATVSTTPHRVVIIDDEPLLVDLITQLLQLSGYQVSAYTDPQQALHALLDEQLDCDLVITDRVMPGLDGLELARRVKQQRPQLPLLLCSAHLGELADEEAAELDFNGYISKPIDSQYLISLVQQQLTPHAGSS